MADLPTDPEDERGPAVPLVGSSWIARAFEDAPAVIALHQGPEHRYVFVNRAYREQTDGRPIAGRTYADAFPEFVAQGYLDIFDTVYRSGEAFVANGARADTPRKAGGPREERYWNLVFQPIQGNDGAVDGLMSFAFEVTDQVLATRQAEAARQRYDDLVQSAGVMVWTMQVQDGALLWAGGHIEAILALPADNEGLRAAWRERIHPEDRAAVVAARASLAGAGDRYALEYRLVLEDGTVRWLSESARLDCSDAGSSPVAWGLTQDVSERVAAQAERERLQAELLHGQKLESLGVLAGGIAHDFNNLLTAILGQASLAEALLPPNQPAARPVAALVSAARRASELTHQLLAYSGRGHFRVEAIDLNEEVRGLSTLMETMLSKKVVLRLDLTHRPAWVDGDRSQLQQVLMNLVLNGAQAVGEASGSVMLRTGHQRLDAEDPSTRQTLGEVDPGIFVFIEVSDTGSGMDADTLARIFDPFFTTKATGRGLGLAAVQGIVRGHRGLITVYSELGRGTTFKVLLPVSAAEVEAGSELFRAQGLEPTVADPVSTILVVDDDDDVRELARQVLEYGGYRVIEARDGLEAVEIFRALSQEISMVLMDMTMPRMSGEEAYREISTLRAEVPVVLSSGYNEVEATRRLVGRGRVAFIQKPYTLRELLAQVAEVLSPAG
jgi:signal transduction histidine kinase